MSPAKTTTVDRRAEFTAKFRQVLAGVTRRRFPILIRRA